MKKLIQFGAGNIGRSFIGQLFSRGGYEVVFVDVAEKLLQGLNSQHRYRVIIKQSDKPDETLWIENVRAVDGRDTASVASEIVDADIIATAVGQRALPVIIPVIAQGLRLRRERKGDWPLDIIIAENLHSAADYFHTELSRYLPDDYPLDLLVGLVETSIGKMVPIMRPADLEKDALWVFAEPYNELILDKHAFKNPLPQVTGLAPQDNMKAYVDRKLYIHNLGHACAAYLGYHANPQLKYIYEVLEIPAVLENTRRAMLRSAAALNREYPRDLPLEQLHAHVEDLLVRFCNRALADTVYRVGRDLYRKLAREDRLVGAMLMTQKHHLELSGIARAYIAGTHFAATDENGALFPADERFHAEEVPKGLEHILRQVSGLDRTNPGDATVIEVVLEEARKK